MTNHSDPKFAIVTGANRGLGRGCAQALLQRGYTVIATARDLAKLKAVASEAQWPSDRVHLVGLDVSNETSLQNFEQKLADFPQVDILINNAGVYLDSRDNKILGATGDAFLKTFMTNVYGPYRMCQIVVPRMQKQKSGRIVNVSSGMGQLSEAGPTSEAYRISKTAVNGLTATLAADLKGTGILVNSVCPGWVKTDMGGAGASRELAEGVESILWAALIPEGGPTGSFFRDGKRLNW